MDVAHRLFARLPAALALGAVGAASAAPPDPLAFYPPAARAQGVEGMASLSCTVNEKGRLEACRVVSETPPGWGFGEAALQISDKFQMRPQTRNKAPIGGATVRIPVRFKLPPEAPTPAAQD